MSPRIHPTAVVDPTARLADDVIVGPYCIVGQHVEIGAATRLIAHVVVLGPTTIGARNVLHPFVVVGGEPQHRAYCGEPTSLVIGNDNTFREHVTVHRGTTKGSGVTRVGDGVLLMVGCHVAHDVVVGDHCTFANGTLLGGHVQVDPWVVTSGHVAVGPFVRVGESAFLAGGAMVERDVPPFVIMAGDRARVRALNRVGLQRRGVPATSQQALKRAFQIVFRAREPRSIAVRNAQQALPGDPFVNVLLAFLIERLP